MNTKELFESIELQQNNQPSNKVYSLNLDCIHF